MEPPTDSASPAPHTLRLRPFVCGRDYHALHHQNPAFRFAAEDVRGNVRPIAFLSVGLVLATTVAVGAGANGTDYDFGEVLGTPVS